MVSADSILMKKSTKVLIALAVVVVVSGIFIGLAVLITAPGAFAVLFCLIAYLIRYLSYAFIFAGSNTIWRRSLEANFCHELCAQGIVKIENIRHFLCTLPSEDRYIAYSALKSANNFLKKVELILTQLTRTLEQETLLNLIVSLRTNLEVIQLEDRYMRKITVWYVLQHPEKFRKSHKLLEGSDLTDSILLCESISGLFSSFLPISYRNILWKGRFVIGGIEYQRIDFLSRFPCEQFFLTGEDGKKIDCMWVKAENSEIVVVYCCPNGGFYEYIYYQTDWLEFYLEIGVSVVLWNYRSYGRSEGSPTIPKLCRDGEILISYIRSNPSVSKIIVHGESLGGCIASHIAIKGNCDLLIADRTFSSLFEIVSSYVGVFLAYAVKVLGPIDIDSVKNYLEFTNKKILTCDPRDGIIYDKASLKAGIARLDQEKLSDKAIKDFVKALKFLSGQKKSHVLTEPLVKKRKGYKATEGRHVYKTLNTEDLEFGIENLLTSFLGIAETVDAGGMNLVSLLEKDESSIKDWINVIMVWGSSLVSYSAEDYDLNQSSLVKLTKFTTEISKLTHEFSSSALISVQTALKSIDSCQIIMLTLLSLLENRKLTDPRLGSLLILDCGHCGSYNSVEKYMYEKLLRASNLFNK